jgi:CHASE2 domain-containing sensor protein
MSKLGQHWRMCAIGAALAASLGLLFLTPLGGVLSHASYELPFFFHPNVELTNVVILYMDDKSHQTLRQPMRQPWDRRMHARAVEHLRELGARAIVFDVLFENPATPAEDQLLIEAAERHGKVLFAATVKADLLEGKPVGARLFDPFDSRLRWGITESSAADRFVRQHYRDAYGEPSLAWRTAEATMSNPPAHSQPRWINYYGPAGIIPNFSYWQVFSNAIPAEAIANKIVFIGENYGIGYSGGVGTDNFITPFTRWQKTVSPGVEVVATAYLNFWRGDWLNAVPRRYEILIVLLFGIFVGALLAWLQPIPAAVAAVAGFLAVAAVATIIMWNKLTWFPWLVPAAVQIPAALVWSVLAYTRRLRQEKEAAERRSRDVRKILDLTQAGASEPTAELGPGGTMRVGAMASDTPPRISDHTLVRRIGKGAYGEVWLARDVIGTYHAAKIIYRAKFPEAEPFDREFHGIEKFTPISRSHPGFVNILHIGRNEAAGYFYYIMELGDDEVTGQKIDSDRYVTRNLASDLARKGRFAPLECIELAATLCSALQYLHDHHLIHRDIKPSNIIFVQGIPKFADIGLVTEIGEATQDVSCVGTPGYMPPEGPGAPTADIYSLGKMIYELCTGLHRNKYPELPTALIKDSDLAVVLIRLNKIILKSCENDPSKRYASAAALRADLLDLRNTFSYGPEIVSR